MGAIQLKADEVLRDFATDGVKSSGANNPTKAGQRELFKLIEDQVNNLTIGGSIDVVYDTRAELDADLAHDAGTKAFVWNDLAEANNDYYIKSGASGAGAWTLTTILHDAIEGNAQPYVDAAEAAQAAAEAAADFISLGNQMEKGGFRYLPSEFNGAASSRYTTTIPAGQTGDDTILYGYWKVPGLRLIGRTIQLVQTFEASDPFTRPPNKVVLLVSLAAGGTVFRSASVTGLAISVDGTEIAVTSNYTLLGDESELAWGAQLDGTGGAAATDETIKLVSWEPKISAVPAGENKAKANFEGRMARMVEAPWIMRYANGARNGLYQEKIILAQAGGDFTDPLEAIAQANALQPGPDLRVEVEVGPGDFDTNGELQPGNFVDMGGCGMQGPNRSLIRFFQDDSATDTQIDTDSVVRLQYNTRLHGLAFWGRNVRYGIHPEIPLEGKVERVVGLIENCQVRHYAKTSANGDNAPDGRNAIGSGTGSGYILGVRACDLWSETGKGFAWHNGPNHAEPTLAFLEDSRAYGGLGTAVAIVAYGSGQADRFHYSGNSLSGSVDVTILPGGAVDEFRVTGHGNTPHAIRSTGSYLPELTDEERALPNTGAGAIAAGDVLAFDGHENAVRLMTAADDAMLFAGIALQPIAAGEVGRVKIKGWMHLDHINTAAIAVAFGATMSVGGTPGQVAAGGAQGLLRAVSDTVVRVG